MYHEGMEDDENFIIAAEEAGRLADYIATRLRDGVVEPVDMMVALAVVMSDIMDSLKDGSSRAVH